MKWISIGSVAAIVLVSCFAIADENDRPDFQPEFSEIDTNDDLYISKEELEEHFVRIRSAVGRGFEGRRGNRMPGGGRKDRMAQLFDDADSDGDGLLNEYEFEEMRASIQESRGRWRQDRGI